MALGTYARFYMVSWLGERVVADLRRAVFDRVMSLHAGFFETTKTGEVLSRLTTDTTLLQSVIGSSASVALRNALNLVGGVIMLFITNPGLTAMVLLVVPVALLIVEKLKVSPYPFLVSQILASNIGGTATLIGDPPNILIGSATGLTFMQFLTNLGPVALLVLIVMVPIFKFMWGDELVASEKDRESIMRFREADSITDMRLLVMSLGVLVLVIAGFIVGEHYHIPPGTTAMFGAAVLLLITSVGLENEEQTERLHQALLEVEWAALLFFIGLFIIVSGVEHAGLLNILGGALLDFTGGDAALTAVSTLWLSAIVSAAVDNIPFVATMIPLVESMEAGHGRRRGVGAGVVVSGAGRVLGR